MNTSRGNNTNAYAVIKPFFKKLMHIYVYGTGTKLKDSLKYFETLKINGIHC